MRREIKARSASKSETEASARGSRLLIEDDDTHSIVAAVTRVFFFLCKLVLEKLLSASENCNLPHC